MLTLLSSIFGILSGLLPGLLRLWERRYEQRHELEMLKIRLEGMAKGVELIANVQDGRSLVEEGANLRSHDLALSGGSNMETLRASVRPIITYSFFGLFCFIKIVAILIMWHSGASPSQMLSTIWGEEETVLLAAILSFWFGSRITTKLEELDIKKKTMATTGR